MREKLTLYASGHSRIKFFVRLQCATTIERLNVHPDHEGEYFVSFAALERAALGQRSHRTGESTTSGVQLLSQLGAAWHPLGRDFESGTSANEALPIYRGTRLGFWEKWP